MASIFCAVSRCTTGMALKPQVVALSIVAAAILVVSLVLLWWGSRTGPAGH